ncbi:C-24(28) sterol reductase [Naganishia albida]|nr:C-24(28) sterol reductase [Naganishia albida]
MSVRQRATAKANKPEKENVTTVSRIYAPTAHGRLMDAKLDSHTSWEFGGPVGVSLMMLGFPVMMYYLWICLWHYHGAFARPASLSWDGKGGVREWAGVMWGYVQRDAYPTAWAGKVYGGLVAVQLVLAWVMPGVDQEGLPVPSLGYRSLTYHCNALSSFYTTLLLALTLHLTGLFRLPWLIESFGPLMSWSIIISFAVTLLIYALATMFHYGGEPIRMSGNTVYDIFMGASLNPRLFTSRAFSLGRKNWQGVDLKMFAEVRVPWVLLFLIAVSGGVKQYEDLGYITPNMGLMILATGLYINACAKGEHMIPQTWDMFHEKFGFMLIFWNMAGVPFTYCYPVIYMARSDPSTYRYPVWVNVAMYVTLLGAYYVFDTSMAQKSAFKMQQQGVYVPRKSFPQLPGAVVENPTFIETKHGNKLLTSGWWAYARKPNYTADWTQSLMWGLSAGLNTPITLFYPAFFLAVLTHRCSRDFERCAMKYGDDWKRYCQVVKYKFIPGVY